MEEIKKTKAAPDQGKAASVESHANYHSNSLPAQRKRLAAWLELHGSITTDEARRELDIMHPAGRMSDLRAQGFNIATVWDNSPTARGSMHRMGRYVYLGRLEESE